MAAAAFLYALHAAVLYFLGLFSSMLSAMSKDFLNLVKSFTTAIFWLSGIMWDVNRIHTEWLSII